MRKIESLVIFIILINCFTPVSSQKLTTGYYGGVNISDIHGNSTSGKWKFKPGPVQGFYLDYSFNRIFGFRTGINYSTLYYEHVNNYQIPGYFPYSFSSSFWPGPYYPGSELSDFSFIAFPTQIRLSVPSIPRLDFMAGIYNAFLIDHNEDYYYYETSKPSKEDFGYIYSVGLSIPLVDDFNAVINARYITGRRKMYDYIGELRHGSIDFSLGIEWNGIIKDKIGKIQKQERDTISESIYLIYKGSFNVSWNSCEKNAEKYSLNFGPSIGFLVNIRLASNSSFRTGLSIDRTGYSLKDSSDSFHRYYVDDDAYYYVDTKTSVDYLTIPLLINFQIGDQGRFFVNTGPFVGIKLNARSRGTVFYNIASQGSYSRYKRIVHDDLEDAVRDNAFGWIIGGGITIPVFKRLAIESGLQYRRGFGEVFDKSYLPENDAFLSGKTVFENSSLSLQIGLRVPVFR
ncbi:MAG: hypothetical protein A2Y71_00280 [Bacteroidetes bacterium RBG_13_42_15]|nr:MAG: hypothetical protein A2Y71_00280 [Bacteroidetes bacterium RBG_13_42_15]